MKFIHTDNPIEWIALKANLIPMPMLHGYWFDLVSKTVTAASRLEVFEAIKDTPQTLEQIAEKTGLNPKGLESLLKMLIITDYIKYRDGKFSLTRMSQKWCPKDSPDGLHDYLKFCSVMNKWGEHIDEYLKTGVGLGVHSTMNEEEWHYYQLAMEAMARITAKAAPGMMPIPRNPTEMLDIGGSHGLYCVEMCKKYPTLKATILELPEAIAKAEPILAKFSMGNRVVYQAGNALTDDFGENRYDLVLMSSLMHHFTAEENIEVSKKVAKALKPGGYFIIQEWGKPDLSRKLSKAKDYMGALTDMMFNFMSTSETWSLEALKGFQQKAGLKHHKVKTFMQMPGFTQVCAKKV